ncbi:recombinase RecT [Mycolicibacterium mucogenicum]|uniref:Recombinase RecT n=1 Tax=Mycolicibacterium mucogenicum DSM 44124 TaxID=1226753 RepID=A0A8H2PFC8_MYCMU|nr:recombinase RecT [Mycolicibacterium mucogenicum]KAB7761213.1 recombinase RecT [Mycolicibacterium mucogenicum DSM 44124]QPG70035.1 recombinase RecT [Mycolicibacterium mucogenicum DSM 44124]
MTAAAPAKRDNAQAPAQQQPEPTLAQLINQMKPEIAKVLPNQMKPERMARIATTALKQTPALARCTPASFLGALLTASQLGLEPGPLGLAYLVPYGPTCTFIPGYRGLIQLARNSGQLVDIWAEIVYEKDVFKQTLGLHRDLVHEPAEGDRGKPVRVYAAAELKDGGRPFVVMTYAEVEAIRARSKSGNNGPWKTDWAEMAKKTAIRRLSKWLPMSAEFTSGLAVDGSVRNVSSAADVKPLVDVQPDYDIDGEVVDESTPVLVEGEHVGQEMAAGAEPAPAPEPDPSGATVMASRAQLAQIKQIRKAEGFEGADSGWPDFVAGAIGVRVDKDSDLTAEQAEQLIGTFQQGNDANQA